MEGFLPLHWALFWWIVSVPFLIRGFFRVKKTVDENREALPLL
jgi:cobalt/nickel transport system permease protein